MTHPVAVIRILGFHSLYEASVGQLRLELRGIVGWGLEIV
jgi:hypothetical protein